MRADQPGGVLAIWHDVRDGSESEFERWYKNEHFPERLAVPGFQLGRRYEAVSGAPRYFCHYTTDSPDVLTSAAYLERLNNPTPLTRKVMSDVFCNMHRTVCRRNRQYGTLSGSLCVTARFETAPDAIAVLPLLESLAGADGVARCEFWTATRQRDDVAAEERLRGGDRRIAACAMVETLRLPEAERVSDAMKRQFGAIADVGIYRLLCELTADDNGR